MSLFVFEYIFLAERLQKELLTFSLSLPLKQTLIETFLFNNFLHSLDYSQIGIIAV